MEGVEMVSIREYAAARARELAWLTAAEDQVRWSQWRADPAVRDLAQIAGGLPGALRHALDTVLARFVQRQSPVDGRAAELLLLTLLSSLTEERQEQE